MSKNPEEDQMARELDDYLKELRDNGTLLELQKKWFDGKDLSTLEILDHRDLPDTKGTLESVVFN